MKKEMNVPLMGFAGVIALIFGAIVLAMISSQIHTMLASQSWKVTPAKVTSFDLFQRGAKNQQWCIRFRYKYVVDGISYENNKFSPVLMSDAGCSAVKAEITPYSEKFAVGSTIPIFYDKQSPSTSSMITPQPGFPEYLISLIGIISIAIAIYVFVKIFKNKN